MQLAAQLLTSRVVPGGIPGGQTRAGAPAQSKAHVVGTPSVQPRLLLAVPLGSTGLPGARRDPTHLGGIRASCPNDPTFSSGSPCLHPFLVGLRITLLRKLAGRLLRNPQGELIGAGFIGY